MSGQRHAPSDLYSREIYPVIHCIGGWMGLRSGLDKIPPVTFYSAQEVICTLNPDNLPKKIDLKAGYVQICIIPAHRRFCGIFFFFTASL
jgi:hypothetical protein